MNPNASRSARAAGPASAPLLGLAPMEGVSDLPVRLWISQTGAPAFAMTPFLRVTRDYPARRIPATYAPETSILRGAVRYALVPQIMGCTVADLAPIAEHLLARGAPFVDFNCGCPSPTVVGNGAGSGLLESPQLFDSYVGSVVGALGADRVSIKMRTGFHSPDEFPRLLEVIARHAPTRLTVHGRTRAQRYQGKADWSLIARAAGLPIEVVGSGDIVDAESHAHKRALFGDGPCLVGRGALRNPFVFLELALGRPVDLPGGVLLKSLDVFALLQHLYDAMPSTLLDAAGEGALFLDTCGLDEEKWLALREGLARAAGLPPDAPGSWEIARGAFFKVKMIWNSWRSGLPAGFFVPEPLRAPSWGDFRACVGRLVEAHGEPLPLRHRMEHDWVYGGGKEHA